MRELLIDPGVPNGEPASALDTAIDFLRQVLGDDVVPSKAIEAEARDTGIALRTVRRASDQPNVKKKRGHDRRWYWSLPKLADLAMISIVDSMDRLDNMDLFSGTEPNNLAGKRSALE